MSHKSDKVQCCLSLPTVKEKKNKTKKNSMHIHDLGLGNILEIKEYQLTTLLHIRITQAQISCEYTQAVQD